MKKLLFLPALLAVLALSVSTAKAQQLSSIVVVGAIVASVSSDVLEFSDLPSGNVIWLGPEGVRVSRSAEDVPAGVPRLTSSGIAALSPMEKEALKRRIQASMDDLFAAMNDPESGVTEDDVAEIMRFLLGLDLPWDLTYFELIDQNLGEGFAERAIAEADFQRRDPPSETRETDPAFIGSTDEDPDTVPDPVQVTDPVQITPYFAP